MGRALTLLGVVVLLALAVLLLVRPGGGARVEGARITVGQGDAGQDAHEPPAAEVPRAAPLRLTGRAAPMVPPSAAASSTGDDARSLVAAWIDVTVDLPPDWEPKGVAYALPAGAPGVDREELTAHAAGALTAGRPLRIPVPRSGRWDVGFIGETGCAPLVEVDVGAGETVPVHLVLRGWRPVDVHVPRGLPPWAAPGSGLIVTFRGPDEARAVPGRGESGFVEASLRIPAPGTYRTPSLPPQRPLRTYAGVSTPRDPRERLEERHPFWRWQVLPERVEAGDPVEVVRTLGGVLDVTLTLEGGFPPSWDGFRTLLCLSVQADDGEACRKTLWFGPGEDAAEPARAVLHLRPGMVRVTWTADGIVGGSIDSVAVPSGEVVPLEVPLRIDPAYRPPREALRAPEPTFAVEVRGMPASAFDEGIVFGRGRDEQGRVRIERTSLQPSDPSLLLTGAGWGRVRALHAVLRPEPEAGGTGWASRPVTLSPLRGATLHLEPAGLVQVPPAVLPSAALGATCIRRQDGEPFSYGRFEEDAFQWVRAALEAPAHPGVLLGPLAPGEYAFEVWIGRCRRDLHRVRVEPGRMTVLRILD